MLPLNDTLWQTLKGGNHTPYNPSATLKKLLEEGTSEEVWAELWQRLHYEREVDSASYAAVPYLLEYARHSPQLDWNAYGLIAAIELARPHNPPVPENLSDAYFKALEELPAVAAAHPDHTWDEVQTQCIASCIALARGQRTLGIAYFEMSLEAAEKWLGAQLGEWQQ